MKNTQKIKNMRTMIHFMEEELNRGSVKEVKTLSNSYLNVLQDIVRPLGKQEKDTLIIHHHDISLIQNRIDSEILPNSLLISEYRDAHDFTVTVHRLEKIKSELDEMIDIRNYCINQEIIHSPEEEKEEETSFYSQEAMELLEQSIRHNHLITHFNEQHRGIGKTSAIIQKAHDEGYSILCSLNSQVEAVIDRARSMGINNLDVYSQHSNLAGKKYKNFLVDELVDSKNMAKISEQGHKIIGGFYRIVVCF